jgi:hypothetical protein
MKKVCLKKLVAAFLIISLVVMYPSTIFAKESNSDDFEEIINLSQVIDTVDNIKTFDTSDEIPKVKTDVQKKTSIKETILQNGTDKIGESICKVNNRNDPIIYYGSYTGYLTGTNDYWLYPATLSAGQYLQVQLTLPDDNNIDYDLWLLDSSFSTLKTSDYYTVTTSTMPTTLPESIGYISSSAETVYVCVYSVGGGSSTDAYTLDYVIGEDNYDTGEPDENTKESTSITFTDLSYTANRTICSPLDNDWYSFTVLDSPTYNSMRFTITSSSDTNGSSFEIYDNVVTGGFGMRRLGYGTDGEMELDPGTYYIRVISTNSYNTYDPTDIPTINMSTYAVSRVDEIEILNYNTSNSVNYNEGYHHRVEYISGITNQVGVRARAIYRDPSNLTHPSVNVHMTAVVSNLDWLDINRPDMAITSKTSVTNSNGIFGMYIPLKIGLGARNYPAIVSRHYYDFMQLRLSVTADSNKFLDDNFYYLIYEIPY